MADGRTSPHGTHDLELVAAFATGDAALDRAARAAQLVASCAHCRQLADDVLALRLATRAMPAPVRTRDFRLSPETAARLRLASPWERFRRSLVAPGGLGRPLSASLMTLGLAGLLVSAVPFLPSSLGTLAQRDATTDSLAAPESNFAAGGAAPQAASTSASDTAAGAKNAPGASAGAAAGPAALAASPVVPAASGGNERGPVAPPLATPAGPVADQGSVPGAAGDAAVGRTTASGPATSPASGGPILAAVSAVALVLGAALLVARRRAGRA